MSYADSTPVRGAAAVVLPANVEWFDRRARNFVAQKFIEELCR